ncbi:NnrS family protein [Kordiimonas sp. SCSIO 12603]|uniref:NnrS family protein n=1 Tax=Kordiimonas sp. SCSIO 12603 TaxID=2829596 RepID=UPI0021042CD7|nr:NnrS family protein [Kordiimonas sp. SCSIO 12603]UTW58346.1 NnrS family protein [Kordiimonas sp. SCSIO 12603]
MTVSYNGPAIFAGSFRVFFFSAALWAIVSLGLWIMYLAAGMELVGDVTSWHAHELIYGYGGAVVAGFAFTAIPNWTGRTPLRGGTLALMFGFWAVARLAAALMLFDIQTMNIASLSEILFFTMFVGLAAREVIAGGNKRNFKIIAVFVLFFLSALVANLNRLELLEVPFLPWQTGLAILLLLICIIGGRIIPAFTANWLKKKLVEDGITNMDDQLPIMFDKFDVVVILFTVLTFVLFIAGYSDFTLFASVAAMVLHVIRLMRWKGMKTFSSPIVLVLHISYLWVPIGFALLVLSGVGLIDETTALHAWTIGAMGSTTLAVMTRATLGHANLPLTDSAVLTAIYTAVNLAAALRIMAAFMYDHYDMLIRASGGMWLLAFGLFVLKFGPIHFASSKS